MQRLRHRVAIGCALVAMLALAASSLSAEAARGGDTMRILFGMDLTSTGTLGGTDSTLEAKGAVSGPGTGFGGGPLTPIPDPFIHDSLPHINYTKHGVTSSDTYSFTVAGGHEIQGSRTRVLTLGVQLSHSPNPSCPATSATQQGAHGVLTIVEDLSGSRPVVKATLDLPCAGIHEEWEGEPGAAVIDVSLAPTSGESTTTSTEATPATGTFVLAPGKTEMTNAQGGALTINAAGGTADWNHTGKYGGAGNAGDWVVKFSWKVPGALVAGKSASVTIGIEVISENPPQQNTYQINALAPDFAQAISVTYPRQKSLSKDFTVPIHADYAGTKELTITIGFVSSGVTFHYEATGG